MEVPNLVSPLHPFTSFLPRIALFSLSWFFLAMSPARALVSNASLATFMVAEDPLSRKGARGSVYPPDELGGITAPSHSPIFLNFPRAFF